MRKGSELKQIRSLTWALFISGALNVFLAAFMIYWGLTDRPITPYCEVARGYEPILGKKVASPTNALLIKSYKSLSLEELTPKLKRKGLIEDGYTERDLALGVLITFFDFNAEKALQGRLKPIDKRWLIENEGAESILVFNGLSDSDYDKLNLYLEEEKWPYKVKGLFNFLQKVEYQSDAALREAFALTSEYALAEKLFHDLPLTKDEKIQLFAEGDWPSFSALLESLKKPKEPLQEIRQRYLLALLKMDSKKAAYVLLQSDYDFALKRLGDASTEQIAKSLHENSPLTLRYLSALATGPRSEQVKRLAKEKYELLSGSKIEPLLSRKQQEQVLTLPAKPIAFTPPPKPVTPIIKTLPKPKKDSLYIVQEGDSLWKIAKRHKVTIEKLRSYNQLKTDSLKPGTPLRIPA